MRKTVRLFSEVGPEQRLGRVIATLPPSAREALAAVADREDLPLVAGSWQREDGGCLVANVVRTLEPRSSAHQTLDLRILALLPELSSRDLNRLIVAWDEAAMQEGRTSDAALRRLLRGGLAAADVSGDHPTGAGATGERARAAAAPDIAAQPRPGRGGRIEPSALR